MTDTPLTTEETLEKLAALQRVLWIDLDHGNKSRCINIEELQGYLKWARKGLDAALRGVEPKQDEPDLLRRNGKVEIAQDETGEKIGVCLRLLFLRDDFDALPGMWRKSAYAVFDNFKPSKQEVVGASEGDDELRELLENGWNQEWEHRGGEPILSIGSAPAWQAALNAVRPIIAQSAFQRGFEACREMAAQQCERDGKHKGRARKAGVTVAEIKPTPGDPNSE